MKENNLISFPNRFKMEAKSSQNKKKQTSITSFKNLDPHFIDKSADDFVNSILSGSLYEELKPKSKKVRNNLTQL
jgi:hypothetical protein